MAFKKLILAASAATLAISPVAANAEVARESAPAVESSELGGSGLIIGLLALAAIIAGIIIAADDGDSASD